MVAVSVGVAAFVALPPVRAKLAAPAESVTVSDSGRVAVRVAVTSAEVCWAAAGDAQDNIVITVTIVYTALFNTFNTGFSLRSWN